MGHNFREFGSEIVSLKMILRSGKGFVLPWTETVTINVFIKIINYKIKIIDAVNPRTAAEFVDFQTICKSCKFVDKNSWKGKIVLYFLLAYSLYLSSAMKVKR